MVLLYGIGIAQNVERQIVEQKGLLEARSDAERDEVVVVSREVDALRGVAEHLIVGLAVAADIDPRIAEIGSILHLDPALEQRRVVAVLLDKRCVGIVGNVEAHRDGLGSSAYIDVADIEREIVVDMRRGMSLVIVVDGRV